MKSVGLVCVALVFGMASGPSLGQAAKAPAPPTRPATTQPVLASTRPPAQQVGSQAISRSIFLANMDTEFRKMDADKNGTVTPAEIEGFDRAVSLLKAQAKNRQLFVRLDADRNGQLSATEFARLASPEPVNAAPMLTHMDINRDQAISLVEYRTATLANFDRMDADKNGIVTPAEMKAAGIGR